MPMDTLGHRYVSSDKTSSAETAGLTAICFALAGVPFVGVVATSTGLDPALAVLAVLSVVGGLAVFLIHGGRRLTAAGIYSLMAGLMTGGGCWYWSNQPLVSTERSSILLAGLTVYTSTALMYTLFWHKSLPRDIPEAYQPSPIDIVWARNVAGVGLALFVSGVLAKVAGVTVGTLAQSTAEVGAIVFAASLLLSGGVRAMQSPVRMIAICLVLLSFYLVIFSGGGRLRLVTVVIAIAVTAQYRLKTPIKLLTVLALVPALFLFGSIGKSRVAAEAVNPNYQAPASGLGSLVNPIATYAQLISQHITGGHGSTFIAEAVVLVPRSMWPGKPVQFGQVVVQRLHPELIGHSNISIPALDAGEWFYNFSWLGLLLMILASGGLIRRIDRWIQRRRRMIGSPGEVYLFVFFAILVGSISDLTWGGLSTWEVRNAQRFLVLLPVLAWCYLPNLPRLRTRTTPLNRADSPTQAIS
jgi:hypothetical protein